MFEIIKKKHTVEDAVPLTKMIPLEVGIIVDDSASPICNGHYIMRTANKHKFEVMNLTSPGGYFKENSKIKIKLLTPGESITIKLFNEEE